jgi:predicted acyltransferase
MTLLQPPVLAPTTLPDVVIAPRASESPQKPQRLLSLDVFRGITIAAMILVNNLGSPKYTPLEHADWNGWTMTDLIFPFFLFIVGVAIPFSFARRSATTEQTKGQLLARVWLRALSLFMLGELLFAFTLPTNPTPPGFLGFKLLRTICYVFVYASILALLIPWSSRRLQTVIPLAVAAGFYLLMIVMHYANSRAKANGWDVPFGSGLLNPDFLRIPGVLQRIGLVYGIAGTIALFFNWRLIIAAIIVVSAVYCLLMFKVPYGPDRTRGSLTFDDNLARYVDEKVFDRYTLDENGERLYTQRHAYRNYPDNEGLLSTIPAIGTALLGILVGLWLRTGRTPVERCAGLLAMGVPVLILGCLLNWWLIPINKILWTPSYVFFTAGLAMLVLGFFFWLIDVLGYRRWSLPLVIFGMNAIAVYVCPYIVPPLMNLVKVTGADGKPQGLYRYLQHGYVSGVEGACGWVTHSAPHMPVIATPTNMTLFTAMFLVFLIWVIMAVMYVFKIFVKV